MTSTDPVPDLGIDALILAGGFGTRLQDHLPNVPKPLAPVGDEPFLGRQLDWLAGQGVRSAVLTVHHMADQIISYAETRQGEPLPLRMIREPEPLGTGGAVANAFREVDAEGPWLVVNGDTHFNFHIRPILEAHRSVNAALTLAVSEVDNIARFGSVNCDGDKITGFQQARGVHEAGFVSCGAYIVEPRVMAQSPSGPFSIEADFFPVLARQGDLNAVTISQAEAFFDIGTPEAYEDYCSRY